MKDVIFVNMTVERQPNALLIDMEALRASTDPSDQLWVAAIDGAKASGNDRLRAGELDPEALNFPSDHCHITTFPAELRIVEEIILYYREW
jgi:hypothetical protein